MEKRKRGRPEVPYVVKQYCIQAAIKNPDMLRKNLVEEVTKELNKKKKNKEIPEDALIPKADKMKELFQMAPEKEAEDKPWSLAKSIEYNFSPEATADLLNLSRWCLAAGLPFTIRHAKWACYLRDAYHARGSNHILAKLVPGMFYSMCDRYAMQDRVSPVINKSLDTIGLDAFISFDSWWEQMTALWVGKLDKVDVMIESETRAKLSIKEPAYGRRADFVILSELDLFNENYGEFIDPNNIDSEIIRIFAYWLRYLSKGTKWVNKSKDERREIAKTLQEEISQEAASVLQGEFGHFFWKPVKLLEVVGYSENKTEKWRETQNER